MTRRTDSTDGVVDGVGAARRVSINTVVPGEPAADARVRACADRLGRRATDDGYEDRSQDFGFLQLKIGDFVWLDTNADGIQDAS